MKSDSEALSLDEARFYNTIIIEMATTQGVPILPWMPRKINSFQYEKLIDFCNGLIKIKEETGKEFDDVTFANPNGSHHEGKIVDFKKMLEDRRDLLVDDTIRGYARVQFPTRTDVTEDEIDVIFGNGKGKVAQQIRNELKDLTPETIDRGQHIINLTQEEEKNK